MAVEAEIDSGTTCAKCGFVNPRSARNHCRKCGAHLRVTCRHCGHGNERSASECAFCGAKLHRTGWDRLVWRVHRRFGTAGFAVALVVVSLLVWSAVYLRSANRKAKEPSPPAQKLSPEELVKRYQP